VLLLGAGDRNLRMIRESLGVSIIARESTIRLSGEAAAVGAAERVLQRLLRAAQQRVALSRQQVLDSIADVSWQAARDGGGREVGGRDGAPVEAPRHSGARSADDGPSHPPSWAARLDVYAAGRPVQARSANQQVYLDAIAANDLVFGIGPAGTGKTYLAVAAGIHLLKSGKVRKLILARPAVEAGEKLGYLPGDQFAKVNPYLRPLMDALHDMMDYPTIKRFMANDVVEVCPLAFMRGRTLNDAAIILDEAQNTTRGQMHMFLTRMGQRSRMVITGDTTQIDLPDPHESGLIDAVRRLRRTPGVAFCGLDTGDVVRHELVQRIIEAYQVSQPSGPSLVDLMGGPPDLGGGSHG